MYLHARLAYSLPFRLNEDEKLFSEKPPRICFKIKKNMKKINPETRKCLSDEVKCILIRKLKEEIPGTIFLSSEKPGKQLEKEINIIFFPNLRRSS